MKNFNSRIDTTKFRKKEGSVVLATDLVKLLTTEYLGRKTVMKQLREMGIDSIQEGPKRYIHGVEIILDD